MGNGVQAHQLPATGHEKKERLLALLREKGQGSSLCTAEELASRQQPLPGPLPVREDRETDPLAILQRLRAGTVAEIKGSWSSGKTTVALAHAAQLTQEGHHVALIDGSGHLYPPALDLLGLMLERMLILQPPPERQVWATEQVLRSGLFALTLIVEPARLNLAGIRRIQLATERSNTLGLIVHQAQGLGGASDLRLIVTSSPPLLRRNPLPAASLVAPPRRPALQLHHRGRSTQVASPPPRAVGA